MVDGDRESSSVERPRLLAATLDAPRTLTLYLSCRVASDDFPLAVCELTDDAGREWRLKSLRAQRRRDGEANTFALTTTESLDFVAHSFHLRCGPFGQIPVGPGKILRDRQRFYDPHVHLGTLYSPRQTTFRVFAPTAAQVRLVLADAVDSGVGLAEFELTPVGRGIHETSVDGDLVGKYYAYKLSGVGFDSRREITDIYATCTQNRGVRSLIVNLKRTDPPGFRQQKYQRPESPADAVIYEMHVRDFSIAAGSEIKQKGRYLGLTESGTHLPGEPTICTGIDHLAELGVTHVQLMPIQDFDNDETSARYNWGYMPMHFNSPDGWYASEVQGPVRIRELKQAIQAFHERRIGVILDVVYNHTASRAGFEQWIPGYYFRKTLTGQFANGSGCGNEFRSESPMARKFILDSLKFWVSEYRVDGFRFDMMGLIDLTTMKQIRDELAQVHPGILIYGEPWAVGPTPLRPITDARHTRGTGIGAFNGPFRSAIRGDHDGGKCGFIQKGDRADGVAKGLIGGIDDWTVDPTDSINYFEGHDNLTVWDKLIQSVPDETEDVRRRMMRFAALILLSSQGTILLHAGQEFCRTKFGNRNSYNAPDEINRVDWTLKKRYADVWAYHRGMIALRIAHPLLRLRTRSEVQERATVEADVNDRFLVYRLNGSGLGGETTHEMLVLLNGDSAPVPYALPEGRWDIHADADRAEVEPLRRAVSHVTIPAHSGMLLSR